MDLHGFRSAHKPKARKPLIEIKNITSRTLRGKVDLDYRPEGFIYTLNVPTESLTTK